jgi:hypothetical protein
MLLLEAHLSAPLRDLAKALGAVLKRACTCTPSF